MRPLNDQETMISHLLKISDNIKKGDGIMVLSMNDNPIGFGISVRNTQDIKILNVTDTVLIHQVYKYIFI
ncbi:hypothetical protein C923_05789 [Plasmodium falciparum UGT5.1]|uniref:UPF0113 domain-containing protein n=1 Tax=Plasmodium falciparum UGT5.1 TaxID=1237627 RepID=W7JFL6_PLAFA|nr:hypothetical protein C923_05789 [Plasmodium falciparum UGT5.1]